MITIDPHAFAPWPALIGGAFIGLSAAMLILLNGRIAGISGIVSGLLKPVRGDVGWRLAFVAGLVLAAALFATVAAVPPVHIDRRLVGGSALFGVGWGLTGFCPGPALVALGMWEIKALVFVIAMLVGMLVFESLEKRA